MVVYSNVTNFMSREGITYKDRVVLQVLLAAICKGYRLVLFALDEGKFKRVNSRILAEYFFTKTILEKSKYVLDEVLDISTLKEEDIYFEVDDLRDENIEWDEYYSQIAETKCQMYSYLYFEYEFGKKEYGVNKRIKKQCEYMNGIFVADEEMREIISRENRKCFAKINVVSLEIFVDEYKEDSNLRVEKGLEKIIKEGNYVINLYDCDNPRTNRERMREIRIEYPDKKVIYVVPTKEELNSFVKGLGKNSELGQTLFVLANIDYYTLLNLYAAASMVIVPKYCKSCEFEIINIQKAKGKYVMV